MRKERKNAIRERIIETAGRLFYRQGYVNTGINQILEESGVVKSSLYASFSSKEEILMEYLISVGMATDESMLAAATEHKDAKKQVFAIFDQLIKIVETDDYYGCTFLNIISEIPKDNEVITQQIKKQKTGLRNLFARLLEPIGKEDLADEIYTLFDGAMIANKVHGELWPVKSARRTVERLLQ